MVTAQRPATQEVGAVPIPELLGRLVSGTVSVRGSDLHLRAAQKPFVRVDGRLTQANAAALSAQQIEQLILYTAGDEAVLRGLLNFEYSFEHKGVARFRCHAFRESGAWALTLRVVPETVPSFQDLRLPPLVKLLAVPLPGLVLVTGPTGSGKSSTLASMINHIAKRETVHIITVEDPIEYKFLDVKACVTQREVGRDVVSYAEALRSAMREDPDVMFIGEIRDVETLEVAMHAAETGHAVFSSFHTDSALKSVQRLIAMYDGTEQQSARNRLADSLRGSISQRLLRRADGRGRVVGTEVMMNNYAVKEAIRDANRTPSLPGVLERSNEQNMHTFDQALIGLVRDRLVSPEVALPYASSPNDFRRTLQLSGISV